MDLAVQFHDGGCPKRLTCAGGERGRRILRLDFLLEMQSTAKPAGLAVKFLVYRQAALAGKDFPRLFDALSVRCTALSYLRC